MIKAFKIYLVLSILLTLIGCAAWQATPAKVVLLPEDRIFSIPAGQKIDVLLDKKSLSMTFPTDMKLVSPTLLVRQEQQLNDATFKKLQLETKNAGIMDIFKVIGGVLAGILAIFAKNKVTKKKE